MFDTTELQVLVGLQSGKTLSEIGEELLLSHPSVSKALRAAEHKAGLETNRAPRSARAADGRRRASGSGGA